jgi:rare lipoprotein A
MIEAIGTSTSVRSSPRATAVCCSLAALGAALISAHLLVTLFEGKPAAAGYSLASAGATDVVLPPESEAVTLMPRSDSLFAPAVETEDTPAASGVIETDPPAAASTAAPAAVVPLPRPRPVPGSQAAKPTTTGTAEVGLGSYYQPSTIACRGPIDPHALTAAHKSLPCGTRVKVTNAKNGRYAMVQINDRGPFIRGRVIDLNQAAARDLDMIGAGVVPVRVEVVR